MAELNRLAGALSELTAILGDARTPFMVIGGIAVLVWGEPRTTQDIDVTVSVAEEQIDDFVQVLGRRLTLLPAHPVDFFAETHVLPVVTASGVPADIIRAGLPYEEQAIQRAVVRELGAATVRVCTPEDLILLKLASTRARDFEDVKGVVVRQGKLLDRGYLDPLVRGLSEMLEDPGIWDRFREIAGA